MPTTYAHDLFGKEVYKRLPSDMKALIRRHGDLYRIGLHGPDILFYYMVSKNPVTQFGIEMHHEKARAFFEEGMRQVRRNNDEALFAYLLGGHFWDYLQTFTDSYCIIFHSVFKKKRTFIGLLADIY